MNHQDTLGYVISEYQFTLTIVNISNNQEFMNQSVNEEVFVSQPSSNRNRLSQRASGNEEQTLQALSWRNEKERGCISTQNYENITNCILVALVLIFLAMVLVISFTARLYGEANDIRSQLTTQKIQLAKISEYNAIQRNQLTRIAGVTGGSTIQTDQITKLIEDNTRLKDSLTKLTEESAVQKDQLTKLSANDILQKNQITKLGEDIVAQRKSLENLVKDNNLQVNHIKMMSNTIYYNKTKGYHMKPSWSGNNLTAFKERKEREFLSNTRYGHQIYIDSYDQFLSRFIAEGGSQYPEMITLIGNFVPYGGVFLNAGVHVGFQSMIMAKEMGPKSRFFLIEPNPINVGLLKKSIAHNHFQDQFTIYQMGVSNKKSSGILNVGLGNTGAARLLNVSSNGDQHFQVQMDRIDEILPKDLVVDFALIDVQRMERQALQGIIGVAQRSPNLILFVEFVAARGNTEQSKLIAPTMDYFRAKGYKFYLYMNMDPYKLGTFKEIPYPEKEGFDNDDVLFVPKSRLHLIEKSGKQWM